MAATSVKFKKGDRVVCVNNVGCLGLMERGQYTIRDTDLDLVYLDEAIGGYYDNRFALATEMTTPVTKSQSLPTESKARKDLPITRGVLDYFPAALAEVAKISKAGNDKHNPGQEMHHARGKSNDHADCIVRHLMDRGTVDPDDNCRHSAKVAWRALALLQEELEAAGAPLARGAKLPESKS